MVGRCWWAPTHISVKPTQWKWPNRFPSELRTNRINRRTEIVKNPPKEPPPFCEGRLIALPDLVFRWLHDPFLNRITWNQHLSQVTAPREYLSIHQPSDSLLANIQPMSHFRDGHECRKDFAHRRYPRPHLSTSQSPLAVHLSNRSTKPRDFVIHSTPFCLDACRQTDWLPRIVL